MMGKVCLKSNKKDHHRGGKEGSEGRGVSVETPYWLGRKQALGKKKELREVNEHLTMKKEYEDATKTGGCNTFWHSTKKRGQEWPKTQAWRGGKDFAEKFEEKQIHRRVEC